MDPTCEALVKKIHHQFRVSGMRLGIAESCTGGLISHLLTSLPGASEFFDSSLVCYSTESKIKLLRVKPLIIKRHGVVSEDTARAMAEGVREQRKTDFSLSTTGNLGPEPMENKKVGLVYMAVSWKDGTTSKGMIFEGERESIKYAAAEAALRFLGEAVEIWA